MNLTSLYYFLEVARELHITRVADRLFISQQTLSAHIHKLEEYYGVELFVRRPALRLTHAGEQLAESAAKILGEEALLQRKMADIANLESGILRVGVPAYRAQICLPRIFPRFYARWPKVSVKLFELSSQEMFHMVIEGSLDLCIGVTGDDPRLTIHPLLDDGAYLMVTDTLLHRHCGPDADAIKAKALSGTDLRPFAALPYMLVNAPMRLRRIADESFKQAGFDPNIFIESSNTELLMALYPNHYGAFFCTQMRLALLSDNPPDSNAFPLMLRGEFIHHQLSIAHKQDGYLPPYATDFIAIAEDVFGDISRIRLQGTQPSFA